MTAKISVPLLQGLRNVLYELLSFEHPADAVLSHFFRANREFGVRDRAFIAETAYAVLRRKRTLERLCGDRATPQRLALAALTLVAGYSQRQLVGVIDKEEAAWLDSLRDQDSSGVTLAEQCDFPDWLVEHLQSHYNEESIRLLARGLNQSAPLDLRVNPLKTSRDKALAQLAAEELACKPCELAPFGIRMTKKIALSDHPLFKDGSLEVQDEGSQLLAHLVQPKRGEMVMDFCAGAGGKTLLLGALMRSTGRLYAFDVSEKRLAKLKPRLARSGLSNVHPGVLASENDIKVKRLAGKFDRVLVDAPCSGLGTLRRNPDLKWRQSPAALAELTAKQASILASAARLVKPGGRLVYATCSILPAENQNIVGAFLDAHPDFILRPVNEIFAQQEIDCDTGQFLQLWPHIHNTDGFFAAVLERRA